MTRGRLTGSCCSLISVRYSLGKLKLSPGSSNHKQLNCFRYNQPVLVPPPKQKMLVTLKVVSESETTAFVLKPQRAGGNGVPCGGLNPRTGAQAVRGP